MKDEIQKIINHAIYHIEELCNGNQFSIAINFCKQALKVDPECAIIWYLMGIAHYHLNNKPEAKGCFEKAALTAKEEPNKILALNMARECE